MFERISLKLHQLLTELRREDGQARLSTPW